jgi:hypothetical protein
VGLAALHNKSKGEIKEKLKDKGYPYESITQADLERAHKRYLQKVHQQKQRKSK